MGLAFSIRIFICSLRSDPNFPWVGTTNFIVFFWVAPSLGPWTCSSSKMTKPHLGSLGQPDGHTPQRVQMDDILIISSGCAYRGLPMNPCVPLQASGCWGWWHANVRVLSPPYFSPFEDSHQSPILQVPHKKKNALDQGLFHSYSPFIHIQLKQEKKHEHPRNSGAIPAQLIWIKLS
jgi:hypothetical protein